MAKQHSSLAPGDPSAPPLIDRDQVVAGLARAAITLVDAQTPGWFERERLPGALRALPADLDAVGDALPVGRDTEIAVYCWDESCSASAEVAQRLIERGYTRVHRYRGGKRDWIAAGLPLERRAP